MLLTLGQAGDPKDLGTLPPHVHVERWWPQRDIMPATAVTVGHGGFGTTQSALAAGVPQVVLPLFSFDQFLNAERVAAVGVGVALADGTDSERRAGDLVPRGPHATDRVAASVLAVLNDSRFRTAARAVATEIEGLPHISTCAASLDALKS